MTQCDTLLLTRVNSLFITPFFLINDFFFSVLGSHPCYQTTFVMLLRLLLVLTSQTLFLMTLIVFRSPDQVYCGMPLCWNFSKVFLITSLGLWVLGRKITEVVSFHYIISRVHTVNIIYNCWCRLWFLGWNSIFQVSPLSSYSFLLLSLLYSL